MNYITPYVEAAVLQGRISFVLYFPSTLPMPSISRAVEVIRYAHSRFGVTGALATFARKVFKIPIEISVHPPQAKHPIWLRAGTTDISVFDETFLGQVYKCELDNPKVIIDAGAHIGMASILFANFYPDAKILAIEPSRDNFRMLEKNTRLYPNIKPIKAALWNAEGTLNLEDPDNGNWAFRVGGKRGEKVTAVTVPLLMIRENISRIDFLKVDIEGAEQEVFESADWLDKVGAVAIELHDRFRHGCEAVVRKAMAGRQSWTRGEVGKGQVTFFRAV